MSSGARPGGGEAPATAHGTETDGAPDELRLYGLLAELGIAITTTRHPAVFTVDEARRACGTLPGIHVKNLFLRDHRRQLYLFTCSDDVTVDLKGLAAQLASGRLSFARADLLQECLGVRPGSVTPFALINDFQGRVVFALERRLARAERVNIHPLHNEATSGISGADLVHFARAVGHEPRLVTIPGQQPTESPWGLNAGGMAIGA